MERLPLQEAEDYIRENYKFKIQSEIAREIGYSQTFVSGRLRKWGLERITGRSFNQQFFDKWNRKSAYWLGYIMADGCISRSKTKNSWAISLSASMLDYDICERFRRDLDVKLKERIASDLGRYGMWRVTLLSEYTYNRLIELGVCERKSVNMKVIEVPDKYLSHYIRGFIDGDGTISIECNDYLRVRMDTNHTNREFIDNLKSRIETQLGIKMGRCVSNNYKIGCSLIRLSVHIKDVPLFMEWLYRDSEDCRMNRKYDKYQEWKSLELSKVVNKVREEVKEESNE